MNAKTCIALPLLAAGLVGCPEKQHASADAAPSAAPSAEPAATTTAPSATTTSTTKPTSTVVLPHINLDAAAALLDAGLAAIPSASASAAPSASAAGATGVPAECNQYAAQQEVCIGKMAAALQGPARAALAAAKSGWPMAASTPAGRDALAKQCSSLLAAANTCK